jgi:uncharacterized protein YndB with AHSA1/START domain
VNARDTTLEVSHLFNAPSARVFDAWLNRATHEVGGAAERAER